MTIKKFGALALPAVAAVLCACAESAPYVRSWPAPAPVAGHAPAAARSGVLFKLSVDADMAGFNITNVNVYFPKAGTDADPTAARYQRLQIPGDSVNKFPYDVALVQLDTGVYSGMWLRIIFAGNNIFTADATPNQDFASFRVEPGRVTVLGSFDVAVKNNINSRDSGGTHFTTTVHRAADSNDKRKLELVDEALSRPEADSAGWRDALTEARRETAFQQEYFSAIVKRDDKALGALLDRGADPNTREVQGFTGLAMAANAGNLSSARLLLERGAAVDLASNDGMTPLMKAASDCSSDVTNLLIEHGAVIDRASVYGNTALMAAAYNGCLDVARSLVAHGADPERRNRDGKSSVDLARQKNHPQIVEALSGTSGRR